jgi:hypothetical protein
MAQQAFRHLAPGGVAGAENQYSFLIHHFLLTSFCVYTARRLQACAAICTGSQGLLKGGV